MLARRVLLIILTVAAGLATPWIAGAQEMRAADGVTLNDEGLPGTRRFRSAPLIPSRGSPALV